MTFNAVTISQLAQAVQADDLEQVSSILQACPDPVNMGTGNNEYRVSNRKRKSGVGSYRGDRIAIFPSAP